MQKKKNEIRSLKMNKENICVEKQFYMKLREEMVFMCTRGTNTEPYLKIIELPVQLPSPSGGPTSLYRKPSHDWAEAINSQHIFCSFKCSKTGSETFINASYFDERDWSHLYDDAGAAAADTTTSGLQKDKLDMGDCPALVFPSQLGDKESTESKW